MSDLDVEASKNFCDSLGESFGVGQDNHATLVSIVYFLLSIRLVDIAINEHIALPNVYNNIKNL